MSQVSERDVEAIKEWMTKQAYLPKAFDDSILKKFLFSCDSSLETTKKCIEELCTRRANMPEAFVDRDPLSKKVKNMLSVTSATTYMAGENELLIHRLHEIPSGFDMYECFKAFSVQCDNWLLLHRDHLPQNQIVIIDIEMYTLALIAKINVFYVQKFCLYLLESMPLRLLQIHVINCPSFYEYIYNVVKPALPDYVRKLIHFHSDHTALYEFIDKKYLPVDYDGENESLKDQQAMWIEDLCSPEKRKIFLDDNLWKADLSKKENSNNTDNTMKGSFRSLAID